MTVERQPLTGNKEGATFTAPCLSLPCLALPRLSREPLRLALAPPMQTPRMLLPKPTAALLFAPLGAPLRKAVDRGETTD
jgi:hypothetical protein